MLLYAKEEEGLLLIFFPMVALPSGFAQLKIFKSRKGQDWKENEVTEKQLSP